jgi:DNA mismatch endonuclease (patch repair protein)
VEEFVKQYIRDGRAPIPTSANISKVMSSNMGRNTGPEMKLRLALRSSSLSGYRLHWKKVPGRPDITYPKHKLAIFVNGCFWHRCPYCKLPLPKSNIEFWKKKFKRNKDRDKIKKQKLEESGWKVFVFWECEIKDNVKKCAKSIKDYIKKNQ